MFLLEVAKNIILSCKYQTLEVTAIGNNDRITDLAKFDYYIRLHLACDSRVCLVSLCSVDIGGDVYL